MKFLKIKSYIGYDYDIGNYEHCYNKILNINHINYISLDNESPNYYYVHMSNHILTIDKNDAERIFEIIGVAL